MTILLSCSPDATRAAVAIVREKKKLRAFT
jgi:hypothetical protein